ncbi:hypothetical protein [Photobacterium lipolyticum]|uniref:Uncharacterized protein n=1 Tax=Photobacterium lipolyticum TaxID=266810 RepID=A0A2T3MWW9_9GAMM|nr:hypothetical protein [Photobacterium lipolyticum]PSW04391.1 hypothetical protein C9I89_13790 [Photobacterium lipolyticum]
MLLWITDTPELFTETENLVIRSPDQLSATSPQGPTFVVIDIRLPQQALINWAVQRKQTTLWWLPAVDIPDPHCGVMAADCSAAEFIPLLSHIYHREGVITLAPGELESALCNNRYARVFLAPTESGDLIDSQEWSLGYAIHRGLDGSLDDFQLVTDLVRSRFKINTLYCLCEPGNGVNLVLTFSN